MATAIKSGPPEEALAADAAKETTMNKEEQEAPSLSYGVIEAVDAYLKLLGTKKLPPSIATAVQAAKAEYKATGYISPSRVAMLQRCFYRARETRYEYDPLPINVLDVAIAEELDGEPHRMLRGDEIASAVSWLAIEGPLTPEEVAWHARTQEQLLLTGWLSQEQLMELRSRFLKGTEQWRPVK